MEVKYQKTLRCQQTLYDELMKIIEDVEKEEIERSINLLEDTFSLEELKANLSAYYILYDGFEGHFRGIMQPFLASETGSPSSHKVSPKPLESTPQRQEGAAANQNPDNTQPREAQINQPEGAGQEAADRPSSSNQSPPQDVPFRVAGAQLEGRAYERIQNRLLDQLKDFQNIDSVNFKMDYQVEVYANEITDNLLQQIQEIENQVQPNIPEFRLRVNVRKDRRSDDRQDNAEGSEA